METNEQVNFHQHRNSRRYLWALILVAAGVVMLGHNLGYVNDYLYHILISWQMLLIVIGVVSLFTRSLIAGIVLLATGLYFLLPRIMDVNMETINTYWPALLILVGLIILLRRRTEKKWPGWRRYRRCSHPHAVMSGGVEDGFVTADVSFGASKHIVLDPVFRGADIDCSFGSVILDLRSTSLGAPETYIDVDCSFGGAEFYIPSHWNVVVLANNSFGGCEDKRHLSRDIDFEHKLIIRGDISFSGLTIKS